MSPTFVSSCTRKSSEDRRTQLNSCESSYPEDRRDSEVLHSQRYWAIAPGLNSAALLARRPATTASRSTSFYFFRFFVAIDSKICHLQDQTRKQILEILFARRSGLQKHSRVVFVLVTTFL